METSRYFGKIRLVLAFLWKIRSFFVRPFFEGLVPLEKIARFIPTAVVEACTIGDNVEIGPHAVVRACVVGDGAKIDEHCVVNLSVVGKGLV